METIISKNQDIANTIITIDFNQLDEFVDNVFQDSLAQFIANESQDENAISIMYINNLYIDGLIQLRKNKINTYTNSKDKINTIIKSISINQREQKVIDVCAIPVKAYYHYKKGDYEKSVIYTNEAIVNDDFFLEKYPVLYGHKIQQLHNVIRTFFRANKTDEACRLNDIVLCHLSAGEIIDYPIGEWINSYDILENTDMMAMVYQLFTETVFTITKFAKNKEDEIRLLSMAFEKFLKSKIRNSKEVLLLKEWVEIKTFLAQKKKINEAFLMKWTDKILRNKFAIMSKPLFYSLYADLGQDDFYQNKQKFIKKHYS